MAKRYELVSSLQDKGKFTNERVVYIGSLVDIDRLTCMYYDSRSMIAENKYLDFGSYDNNCLSIRYQTSNLSKPFYIPALFNQKEMKGIIDSVHLESFNINGKKIFTEVVDVKDSFFLKMRLDFYDKLNSVGSKFIDEVIKFNGSSNLALLARNYLTLKTSEFYSSEDSRDFDEIKRDLDKEFSRYINFRNYIIAIKKYNKNNTLFIKNKRDGLSIRNEALKISNIVVNRSQLYPKIIEYLDTDNEREEFLEIDEIEKSVGVGNDIKGYKGYVKR